MIRGIHCFDAFDMLAMITMRMSASSEHPNQGVQKLAINVTLLPMPVIVIIV